MALHCTNSRLCGLAPGGTATHGTARRCRYAGLITEQAYEVEQGVECVSNDSLSGKAISLITRSSQQVARDLCERDDSFPGSENLTVSRAGPALLWRVFDTQPLKRVRGWRGRAESNTGPLRGPLATGG